MTTKEADEVIIKILQIRKSVNKAGGRKHIKLSKYAKDVLQRKKVGRSFWRRFQAQHPKLAKKRVNKVSVSRGLNCTRQMAIEYIDELAEELIDTGIATSMKQIEPGRWKGDIDTSRIWAHDETPQFVSYNSSGNSRALVLGTKGEDCAKLIKENRDCITVQPFSSFKGDLAMCQVIFSGAGITSHMAPEVAENQIENLLVSVSKSAVSDHKTLLAGYKTLDNVLLSRDIQRPIIVIADGHGSRFDEGVMSFCQEKELRQLILPPDTSGVTQKHDQLNGMLHKKYEEAKANKFTCYASLNREDFMNLLSEIWNDWAKPEAIQKTGKKVGITSTGLDVEWMDQAKFKRAESILNPGTPPRTRPSLTIDSPVGLRKCSLQYYKYKYEQAKEKIEELQSTPFDPSAVPSVFRYDRIKPKKSKNIRITSVHGSMTAKDILSAVKENNKKNEENEKKKKDTKEMKQKESEMFILCKNQCKCEQPDGKCAAIGLKQCTVCHSVLKSQCTKKGCRTEDGNKPSMMKVSEAKKKNSMQLSISSHSSDEAEESVFYDIDDESNVF